MVTCGVFSGGHGSGDVLDFEVASSFPFLLQSHACIFGWAATVSGLCEVCLDVRLHVCLPFLFVCTYGYVLVSVELCAPSVRVCCACSCLLLAGDAAHTLVMEIIRNFLQLGRWWWISSSRVAGMWEGEERSWWRRVWVEGWIGGLGALLQVCWWNCVCVLYWAAPPHN